MNSASNSSQSFWTLPRIGLVISAALLIGAIANSWFGKKEAPAATPTISVSAPGQPSAPSAPAASAKPAAPVALPAALMEAKFNTIDGKSKKLSDYSGKILVLDLWATWCGPCRQEIPHLVEIANNYKSKGVEVVGLTTEDPAQADQQVKDFSKQFKINYPIGYADPQLQFGLMNGRNGIPQTFILGRDGKVLNHFVGFSAPISVPQMKAALDQAVGAS